jgi:hypothetical protein
MDRLPVSDATTLDALFAGMPRRAFWAAGPVDRSDLEELRRETDTKVFGRSMLSRDGGSREPSTAAGGGTGRAGRAGTAPGSAAGAPDRDAAEGPSRAVPGPREVIEATGSAAWAAASKVAGVAGAAGHAAVDAAADVAGGLAGAAAGAAAGVAGAAGAAAGATFGRPGRDRDARRRIKGQLDPAAELARAREELGHKPDRAFMRLALILRHDPTFAPAVLDTLHLRREPMAALLRGDAQRLLGRHLEAEAAFDAAAESIDA